MSSDLLFSGDIHLYQTSLIKLEQICFHLPLPRVFFRSRKMYVKSITGIFSAFIQQLFIEHLLCQYSGHWSKHK